MNHTHAAGRAKGEIEEGASWRATGTHKINTLSTRRRGLYARRTHVVVPAQQRRRARLHNGGYDHVPVNRPAFACCPSELENAPAAASPRYRARPRGQANAPAPWRSRTIYTVNARKDGGGGMEKNINTRRRRTRFFTL